MKYSPLLLSATALAIATTFASSASAATISECGRIQIKCRDNYHVECIEKSWTCVHEAKGPSVSCISACPDGFQYPTCDPNGNTFTFGKDPCARHGAVAKTCDGANPLLCVKGSYAACVDGAWTCATSGETVTQRQITLNSITPNKTFAGKNVVIEGKGFAAKDNIIIFADSVIPGVRSQDRTHLAFRIPAMTVRPCYITKEAPCKAPTRTYAPGTYAVSVKVGDSISNTLTILLGLH